MAAKRHCPGLAFSGGKGVYAVGGGLLNGPLVRWNTVELFSKDSHSWHTVSPMQSARAAHATASLDGFIYASGGWTGGPSAIVTVEQYDPEEHSWQLVAPLSEGRTGHGMAVLKESLYAIGGYLAEFWGTL